MRKSYIIAGLLLAGVITSCTRENEVVEPAIAPIGDTGGHAIIQVIPTYLNKDVQNCMIYLAYDSKRAKDNNGQYDDTFGTPSVNGRPTATFAGLKDGMYYLYGEGIDPKTNKMLTGGATFTVVDTIVGATYTVLLDLKP